MRKISLTFLALTTLILISCSDQESNNHMQSDTASSSQHQHDTNTTSGVHEEHSNDQQTDKKEDNEKLVLNHGERWQLSESLVAASNEMAMEVSKFYKAHKTTMDDYHALAETLSGGINKLINQCELPDGEAHENLHKWLHPYMEDVAALKKVDNSEDARNQLETIRKSFNTFKTYFK